MFITTIVFTIFFYSSHDPIVGMPLYFEVMLVSIVVSVVKKHKVKVRKLVLICIGSIIVTLMIQLLNIYCGINITQVILLKESDTDVMNIATQLTAPKLNFTVFKHFSFYMCYLIFVFVNSDLLKNRKNIDDTFKVLIKGFKILFICLIIESLIVNALGGYNDRHLMQIIFGFKNLNMQENWKTFGIFSVAFSFTERSYMGVVIVYYLILSVYKKYDYDFLKWFIISIVAVLCTGSSTALVVVLLFAVYFFRDVFIKGKSSMVRIGFLLAAIIGAGLFAMYSSMLLNKINVFFDQSEVWSSGYFRRQSITYGLKAIEFSPLIGIGIGTVYAHSMIIQTVANIGILGVVLGVIYHIEIISTPKINIDRFYKVIITIIICSSTFTVQDFTSPLLLCLILGCFETNVEYERISRLE